MVAGTRPGAGAAAVHRCGLPRGYRRESFRQRTARPRSAVPAAPGARFRHQRLEGCGIHGVVIGGARRAEARSSAAAALLHVAAAENAVSAGLLATGLMPVS